VSVARAAGRRRSAALCAALVLVAHDAHADRWLVENTIEARLESNDNVNLVPNSPGIVNTVSLSTNLNASRQVESAATRASLAATALHQQGPGSEDRIDGQLGISQSLVDLRNTWSGALTYSQDFNNLVQTADVAVARGRRRQLVLAGSWSYALSERLNAGIQVSFDRTGYGVAGANDFDDARLSANTSWLMSEIDSISASASHTRYRTLDGSSDATTDDVGIGWSRALSERGSASLTVGAYHTVNSFLRQRLACPLPLPFCTSGLVPFIVVVDKVDHPATGFEFSASYRHQMDERSAVQVSAASQQSPTGAGGIVTSETLSASATRALSPTVDSLLSYAYSRQTAPGGAFVYSPAQQHLALSLSRRLAPDLSVSARYEFTRGDASRTSGSAHSNAIGVGLAYAWPRVERTH